VLGRVPDPQGKDDLGNGTLSQNMQLQIAAILSVLCRHLPNKNEAFGGLATAIPPFAKPFWSLLNYAVRYDDTIR